MRPTRSRRGRSRSIPRSSTPASPSPLTGSSHWVGRSTVDVGVSGSTEYDYFHAGIHGKVSRDFHGHRNTILDAGLRLSRSDIVEPVGGAPIPLAAMLARRHSATSSAAIPRPWSTCVDRRHPGPRRAYASGRSTTPSAAPTGYLTDPYKLLSVVDPVSGGPAMGLSYESRPDQPHQAQPVRRSAAPLGSDDVLDGSYRYMTDDWGVDSHTVDLRYRFGLGRGYYLEPHAALLHPGRRRLLPRALPARRLPLPDHASADYAARRVRRSDVSGSSTAARSAKDGSGRARVEHYTQSGTSPPQKRRLLARARPRTPPWTR